MGARNGRVMAWAEPPLRDPTVLRLGRMLFREKVPKFHENDYITRASREAPKDLAWAVQYGTNYFVMKLKCVSRKNGDLVFYHFFIHKESERRIAAEDVVGRVFPLFGYKVDSGVGWLRPLMATHFNLRAIQPIRHAFGSSVKASVALASPIYVPYQPLRKHEGVYVCHVQKKTKRYVRRSGSYKTKIYVWCPVVVVKYYKERQITRVRFDNFFINIKRHKAFRLRVIHDVPRQIVNLAHMRRMTVMFYAVRLEVALERRGREIVRWNPFRYIGVDLCALIAQKLDCCDASGALLPEYRDY